MTLPKTDGNYFQFKGYCFATALSKIFAVELGASGIAVDGGYKVRSEDIAIQNIDSTAELLFSFDTTTYNQLDPGAAFSQRMSSDRIFMKCGTTDNSCYVQLNVALKNNWKF